MTVAVRRFVLFILLLGLFGTAAELLLLAHYEDVNQWIPLALIGLAVVALIAGAARPTAGTIRVIQTLMAFFILAGVVGVVLHFKANLEFQTEVDPSLSGWPLVQKALLAKAPPALAPGAMIQLGLLGVAYTFRHPALKGPETENP
jgi:hypothetical protein